MLSIDSGLCCLSAFCCILTYSRLSWIRPLATDQLATSKLTCPWPDCLLGPRSAQVSPMSFNSASTLLLHVIFGLALLLFPGRFHPRHFLEVVEFISLPYVFLLESCMHSRYNNLVIFKYQSEPIVVWCHKLHWCLYSIFHSPETKTKKLCKQAVVSSIKLDIIFPH